MIFQKGVVLGLALLGLGLAGQAAEPGTEPVLPADVSDEIQREVPVLSEDQPQPERSAVPVYEKDPIDLWLESLVDPGTRHPIHFHMLFHGGYQNSSMNGLQAALSERDYGQLSQDFWSVGGAVQMVAWNVVTEFEASGAMTMPVINAQYWLMATASNTFFNLGYQFEPHENLRIYPLVGIGLSFLELQFMRRALVPTFGEFLDNPLWHGHMANQIFALNLGLGIEWQGWLGRMGLRGGYVFHPIAGNWWTTSSPHDNVNREILLADGPPMRMDGPYLRLVLGF